jgi:hypothetical protein
LSLLCGIHFLFETFLPCRQRTTLFSYLQLCISQHTPHTQMIQKSNLTHTRFEVNSFALAQSSKFCSALTLTTLLPRSQWTLGRRRLVVLLFSWIS